MIDVVGQPGNPPRRKRLVSDAANTDAEIYAQLAPDLIRFAASLAGPSNAEDLLGTAFLKAITTRRWPLVTNHRAYLYRTLVNEAHSFHRSSARRYARELRTAEPERIDARGVDHDVYRALRTLTVRQRAVIHLTYWVDLAPQQVAETLQLTRRTVERELTTARSALQELLA